MINLRLALPIFFSKPVVLRAVKVAIIVGVILAFINHGGLILSGNITTECWVKMPITCFVPYTVSSSTALLNGFVSEIERKQKSQYLIEEIFAFGKEPFIAREPLTAIKEDERELLVLMCITNK